MMAPLVYDPNADLPEVDDDYEDPQPGDWDE